MNTKDNSPIEKKHYESDHYNILKSKYKQSYGIPPKLISIYHKQLYHYYKELPSNKKVLAEDIHKIIRNFFSTYHYPFISKNFHTDEKTMAVIMGTTAFNMNVPPKFKKFLPKPTDDIDLKLYTTLLHYDKAKQDKKNEKTVMSVFKYIVLVITMFMKQITYETMKFFKTMFEETKPNYKKSRKDTHINETSFEQHTGGYTTRTSSPELLKHNKKYNGIVTRMNLILQIKNKNELENPKNDIDITSISYDELHTIIMEKINNIDLLITTKFKYYIKTTSTTQKALTFTDSQIKYPNLLENSTFYSYYLLNNKTILDKTKQIITLDKLYKSNININEIIKVNKCGTYNNNCNYTDLQALKVDLVLMLQYAEFINTERYDETINIIVPIGALFKYCKYLIKYLRLYIIIKYANKPLDKEYNRIIYKFQNYIEKTLNLLQLRYKTVGKPEYTIYNIEFKLKVNELHQNLFINQSLLTEYEELREAVDDYNYIKKYINKSRFLFLDEYEKYIDTNKNSNMDYLTILRHIYTNPEYNPEYINPVLSSKTAPTTTTPTTITTTTNLSMNGGMNTSLSYKQQIILKSKTKPCRKHTFILYNDIDDDINDNFQSIYKEIQLSVKSKHSKYSKHSKPLNTNKKCKNSHYLKKSKKCSKNRSKKNTLQSKFEIKRDIDRLIIDRIKTDLHDEMESLKELTI